MACGWRGPMDETLDRVRAGEDDPACLECGGILKSATISFGENLVARGPRPGAARGRRAPTCSSPSARRSASTRRPALPEIALRNGATLVIVNAEATPFDDVADAVVRDQLGEVLPGARRAGLSTAPARLGISDRLR